MRFFKVYLHYQPQHIYVNNDFSTHALQTPTNDTPKPTHTPKHTYRKTTHTQHTLFPPLGLPRRISRSRVRSFLVATSACVAVRRICSSLALSCWLSCAFSCSMWADSCVYFVALCGLCCIVLDVLMVVCRHICTCDHASCMLPPSTFQQHVLYTLVYTPWIPQQHTPKNTHSQNHTHKITPSPTHSHPHTTQHSHTSCCLSALISLCSRFNCAPSPCISFTWGCCMTRVAAEAKWRALALSWRCTVGGI